MFFWPQECFGCNQFSQHYWLWFHLLSFVGVPGGHADDGDVDHEDPGSEHHQHEGEPEGGPALAGPLALLPDTRMNISNKIHCQESVKFHSIFDALSLDVIMSDNKQDDNMMTDDLQVC